MMMSSRLIFCSLVITSLLLGGCASSEIRKMPEAKRKQLSNTHVQLGIEYMNRNKWDYAKEKFERALELDPDSSQANNAMGLLLWRLKQMEEAEQYLERAVELSPNDSEALNNFGVFLCDKDKVDKAMEYFQKAISNPLYKTPEIANQNAGLCLIKKSDYSTADIYLRAALKLNPKLPESLAGMAKVSYRFGNMLSARAFLQRYFEIAEDRPEVLLLAIRVEQRLGARDQEASYRLRLKGKFPESPEANSIQ